MGKPSSRPSPIKDQAEPFNLDAVEKESDGKAFRFTLGDRVWTMTALGRLDRKVLKRIAGETESEIDSIESMLRAGLGDDQWEDFDELPLSVEGVKELFKAWTDHSGIEAPESSASSSS